MTQTINQFTRFLHRHGITWGSIDWPQRVACWFAFCGELRGQWP